MNKLKILPVLLLTACIEDRPPDPVFTIVTNTEARVQISRIHVFQDDLAYENQRGIYIITDNKTGKEMIGISGIGITEVGSHTEGSGKSEHSVQDER